MELLEAIHRLLTELDEHLRPLVGPGEYLDLYQIGRMTLIQHFGSGARTADLDVLMKHDSPLLQEALRQFGRGTEPAQRLGLYLEGVPTGLPPVPAGYEKRCTEVVGPWQVVRLWRPEPHDLAVTKLNRFAPKDRQDVRWLCDQNLLQPELLRERLGKAFLWSMEKDCDPIRDRAFANLEKVLAYLRDGTEF